MKIYFAHPVSDYGSEYERLCIKAIFSKWPDAGVVNPNSPFHEREFKKRGMEYFLEVVRGCDLVVATPFQDGRFGAGVWAEIQEAKEVLVLEFKFRTLGAERHLDVEETKKHREKYRREYLGECLCGEAGNGVV